MLTELARQKTIEAPAQYLWLTLADPEPRHNGQFIYSGGLIDAMIETGARIDILGLARSRDIPSTRNAAPNASWWLSDNLRRSSWRSLLSVLPGIADRAWTPQLRRRLQERLAARKWDAIVFDSISVGWALGQVLRHYPDRASRPRLIYISHNHERSLRAQIAGNHPNFLKRQVLRFDAVKTGWLESRMLDAVDMVTAITPEDRMLYLADRPDRRVEVLTPGYSGQKAVTRHITPAQPRRAIILGSFDWIAKRINLEQFIAVADPLFAAGNAELQVVGSADEDFLRYMRGRVSATRFTGTVDGVLDFMREARVALVVERFGGGFKLKVLDYIFNRMPILALNGSVAGVPLQHQDSILYYPDYAALARGALQVIDDFEQLNRLHDRAYDACRDGFHWTSRGTQLATAIGAL